MASAPEERWRILQRAVRSNSPSLVEVFGHTEDVPSSAEAEGASRLAWAVEVAWRSEEAVDSVEACPLDGAAGRSGVAVERDACLPDSFPWAVLQAVVAAAVAVAVEKGSSQDALVGVVAVVQGALTAAQWAAVFCPVHLPIAQQVLADFQVTAGLQGRLLALFGLHVGLREEEGVVGPSTGNLGDRPLGLP